MKSVNCSNREVAGDRVAPAEEENRGDAERRQEDQPGQEARLDRRLAHRLVANRLGADVEAVADVVLAPERLHHLDADDRLVGRLRQVPLLLLHLPRDGEDAAGEDVGEDRDRRHRQGSDQREPGVDGDQHDGGTDEHHHALQRLHDAPADEVAHRVDVVRGARDHLAGGVPVVEGARVAQVGVVEHAAQPCLDSDADAGRGVAAGEVDARTAVRRSRRWPRGTGRAARCRRRRSRCRSSAGSGSGWRATGR